MQVRSHPFLLVKEKRSTWSSTLRKFEKSLLWLLSQGRNPYVMCLDLTYIMLGSIIVAGGPVCSECSSHHCLPTVPASAVQCAVLCCPGFSCPLSTLVSLPLPLTESHLYNVYMILVICEEYSYPFYLLKCVFICRDVFEISTKIFLGVLRRVTRL